MFNIEWSQSGQKRKKKKEKRNSYKKNICLRLNWNQELQVPKKSKTEIFFFGCKAVLNMPEVSLRRMWRLVHSWGGILRGLVS